MAKQNINSNTNKTDGSELHWFWKLTTKWYFFPLFYVSLSLIFTIIYFTTKESVRSLFFLSYIIPWALVFMLFMPAGLMYLIFNVLGKFYNIELTQGISAVYIIIFWLLVPISIFKIYTYKSKRNEVLKWLIITLIVVMLLSFIGFFSGVKIGHEH